MYIKKTINNRRDKLKLIELECENFKTSLSQAHLIYTLQKSICYQLTDDHSQLVTNVVQIECCKELPPILLFDQTTA